MGSVAVDYRLGKRGISVDEKIKVLIVDDAAFMVKAIRDILNSDPDIEVLGSARNGLECLQMIQKLRPDVITLDVDMPVMDGIKAVRHIMIESPVPIVMLSSLGSHGDITFEALRLGVVDFLPKPSGAISKDIHKDKEQIIQRVKIATAINIENVRRVKLPKINTREKLSERYGFQALDYLITVGTTIGGPSTVIKLMSQLSPRLPAAVVVVQEISPKILPAFAEQFSEHTPWRVEVGKEGALLEQGVCYICAYDDPFVVQLNAEKEACLMVSESKAKPLDALFSSAAQVFEQNAIGLLLTGVGDDGAEGFARIKQKDGTTIAQDTDTCVYPNLTQCAIERGTVDMTVQGDLLSEHIEMLVDAAS